jgi:hypothetical protein
MAMSSGRKNFSKSAPVESWMTTLKPPFGYVPAPVFCPSRDIVAKTYVVESRTISVVNPGMSDHTLEVVYVDTSFIVS